MHAGDGRHVRTGRRPARTAQQTLEIVAAQIEVARFYMQLMEDEVGEQVVRHCRWDEEQKLKFSVPVQ